MLKISSPGMFLAFLVVWSETGCLHPPENRLCVCQLAEFAFAFA